MKVLLIVPAYNEQDNIEKVISNINKFRLEVSSYELDYIIINDCSTDRTAEICAKNQFNTINLIQNLGIGGAVQTGYMFAKMKNYDIAVQFDGDGQHDIMSLDDLIAPIFKGESDFVIGSRFLLRTSVFCSTGMRRVGIRLLSFIIWLFAGCRLTDPTSGFRAANKDAIAFLADCYPVDYPEPESIVALSKRSFGIKEVQVNMFEREGGVSSISSWKSVYYMVKVSLAIICTSFKRKEKR